MICRQSQNRTQHVSIGIMSAKCRVIHDNRVVRKEITVVNEIVYLFSHTYNEVTGSILAKWIFSMDPSSSNWT